MSFLFCINMRYSILHNEEKIIPFDIQIYFCFRIFYNNILIPSRFVEIYYYLTILCFYILILLFFSIKSYEFGRNIFFKYDRSFDISILVYYI